jgi:hypothetical protein
MRKSNPLTAEALAELGADRLAAVLLVVAEHDVALARSLRIAVAARDGADSAAAASDAEIRRLKGGTDGNCYWVLGPAAEGLEPKEPLPATLLYRKTVDFTLGRARSRRYGHAARHLRSCTPNRSAIGAGIYPTPTTTLICANSTAARLASRAGSITIADRK